MNNFIKTKKLRVNQWYFLPFMAVFLMLYANHADAASWHAVQGDVIEVTLTGIDDTATLTCFGQQWPVKPIAGGGLRGWIGVDLKKKAGHYPIVWQGKKKYTDDLLVQAGSFRISRITVKKSMSQFDAKAVKRIHHDQKMLRQTYSMNVDASPEIKMNGLPVQGIVSTPFGAQRYVNGKAKSPHSGVDIAAAKGTPLLAPLGGKILLREAMFLNGNTVVIGHGNGLVSVYCHMNNFAVKQGEWIKTGQKLGTVGQTGRSTGPHVHWGVHFGTARVNPMSLLKGNAESPMADRPYKLKQSR
ncbi:MAG: M23 family metallopeptidase [Mariprofundaceae bacterium]|nr:M23 family metallopeptidase [Mariprofundaceae bacterium]